MNTDDGRRIGITQRADTVKRSNCSNIMPTKRSMMTRGAAWNVIRERNWVQQTIADKDKNTAKIIRPFHDSKPSLSRYLSVGFIVL